MLQNIQQLWSALIPAITLALHVPTLAAVASVVGYDTPPLVSEGTVGAALVLLALLCILGGLALLVLMLASMWRLFEKAGEPGWSALIPMYSGVKILEFTNRPLWWILLLFVPFVNVVLWVIISYRIARVFGKGAWFTVGLVCLPCIFYPILGFGKSVYENKFPHPTPMSEATKWALVALVVALVTWHVRGH